MQVDDVAADSLVLPGQLIGSVESMQPGEGVYLRGSSIYASLFGHVVRTPPRIKDEDEQDVSTTAKVFDSYCSSLLRPA